MMHDDAEYRSHKRKIWRRVALVLVVVAAVLVNTAGLLIGAVFYDEFCVLNTRIGLERFNSLQAELDQGKRTKSWQDVTIQSRFGYPLQGTYLPSPTPSDKTVIFVHGVSASRLMGLWYADLYLGAGYNLLIYDSRAHGASGGDSLTWGHYEKYDLDQWVDWLKQRQPQGVIGVHGVSMGAATALLHAELNESSRRVNFYIADSAYSSLEDLLTQQLDASLSLHNPLLISILLKYSSIVAYLKAGFLYHDVLPLRSVAKVTTPVLYLHGEADPLVPVAMCRQLYAATAGYRQMHTFPKVGHAMAIFADKAEYRALVRGFIQTLPPAEAGR
ncbi:MAG: alpha/beta hydrolase [Negativicutes bacterium]|nr:alpha/beta hydrolase [Negativicutes bacterium]